MGTFEMRSQSEEVQTSSLQPLAGLSYHAHAVRCFFCGRRPFGETEKGLESPVSVFVN